MHSAFSIPTHAEVPDAGLQNVAYTCVSGFRINVLPQLAGPTIIKLRCLPQPLGNDSLTKFANSFMSMPFFAKTSLAHLSHSPLHAAGQLDLKASVSISIRVFCVLANFSLENFIFKVVSSKSARAFGVLLRMNSIRSVFPLSLCSCAKA